MRSSRKPKVADLDLPWQFTPGARFASSSAAPALHRRKRKWLWSIVSLLVLAALAAGGWFGWHAWSGSRAAAEMPVTAKVQRGDLEDAITATGNLQPVNYVDVGTQVSGQLKVLRVGVGASVKRGDLLGEIDPAVYISKVDADRAQLRNQQAQLAAQGAQLRLAQNQLSRQQDLMREEATTTEQLQIVEATVASSLAQMESLKAQIQQAESTLRGDEANLGYTKIYAPMTGTVVSLTAMQGQTLNANQQAPIILRIADLSTMRVQAQVSEADVPKLRVGMEVYFTTLGSDRRWYGKLRQVNPTPGVVNNVVLYDALFEVPNDKGDLMTQMTAQIFFVAASAKDTLYVPVTALRPLGRGRVERDSEGGPRLPGIALRMLPSIQGKERPGKADVPTGAPPAAALPDARPAEEPDSPVLFAHGRARVTVIGKDGASQEREVKVGIITRAAAQILSGLERGEQVVLGERGKRSAQRPQVQGAPKFMPRL